VDRLEQLLDELQQSDGRIAALEQLLQASEESTRAEQEERRQLEAWVTDIETRIVEREADWSAEKNVLRSRLQEVTEERAQLSERLKHTAESRSRSGPDPAMLEHLRAENARLQHALHETQNERTRLTEQIGEQQDQLDQATQSETALRQERLAVAQERASITRERAELAAMKSELEYEPPTRPTCEIDDRVRVFREHLREIHNTERQERTEHSLTARVARIWKRLETRA
jgi:chromosome segregation ATPase